MIRDFLERHIYTRNPLNMHMSAGALHLPMWMYTFSSAMFNKQMCVFEPFMRYIWYLADCMREVRCLSLSYVRMNFHRNFANLPLVFSVAAYTIVLYNGVPVGIRRGWVKHGFVLGHCFLKDKKQIYEYLKFLLFFK